MKKEMSKVPGREGKGIRKMYRGKGLLTHLFTYLLYFFAVAPAVNDEFLEESLLERVRHRELPILT